jgi:hypothetical protein
MKLTFWSNVTVIMDLVDLCLRDYQELGQKRYLKWSMVDNIGEWAASSRNEKVFKWVLRNDFYIDETGEQYGVFVEATQNGHVQILKLADKKELYWYNREIRVGAAARTNLELLELIFNKKPTKFDLGFTRMCACKGYIEVLEWWKESELIDLFIGAENCGQLRMLDKLYENEYQQATSDLREFLNGSIVNWAACGRQIDALEWAWAHGIHC